MPATPLPDALRSRVGTARDLLRRPVEEDGFFPVTLEPCRRLLPEGLARGEITELVGRTSSGRFSLLMSILATVTRLGEAAALVDLGDHFDPQQAQRDDVVLERLLWVRPRHLKEALVATETAVNGGFPFLALDLGTPPVPGGRGAQSSWLRLLGAVRGNRGALLVSSPYRVSGTAATTVIETRQGQGGWRGGGPAQRLLRRLHSQLSLQKARGRMPGAKTAIDFQFHQGGVTGVEPDLRVVTLAARRTRADVA